MSTQNYKKDFEWLLKPMNSFYRLIDAKNHKASISCKVL